MKRLLTLCVVLLCLASASWGQNFISNTFFGMHAHESSMPSVNFGSYRFWDSGGRWAPMNPFYGSYSFSWLDQTADVVHGKGASVFIYTFGDVPSFAQTNHNASGCAWGSGTCSVPNSTDFRVFVQALAIHSAARKALGKMGITHYELWNEPNAGNFFQGTAVQLVYLASIAYPIIHQYDPSAKVSSPAPQGKYAWQWLQAFLSAGGNKYVDTVDYHGYLGTSMPESGIANVSEIKALMSQYGLAGKPLLNTESYWWGYSGSSATAWLARKYVLDASQGVNMFCWYAWSWGGSLSGSSNATVYKTLQSWLLNHTVYPMSVSGSIYKVGITGASGFSGMVVWSSSGSTSVAVTGTYSKYIDVWGGTHYVSGGKVPIGTLPVMETF